MLLRCTDHIVTAVHFGAVASPTAGKFFYFFFIFYKALSGDVVVSDTSRMSSPEKTCHLGSPIPVVRRAIQIKTTDRGSEGSDGSVMELVPILTATLTRPYPRDDEAFAFCYMGRDVASGH